MRKNFKTILKLFAIGTLFVLGGCEKDAYDDAIYQNNKIVMKRVSLKNDTLKMNFNLMNAVNKVREKCTAAKNPTSRMVYDSINNFYFDDENGKYLELGAKSSFTFPVYRDNGDGKVENIVFNKKTTGEYEPILAKYEFTEQQMESATVAQMGDEFPVFSNLMGARIIVIKVTQMYLDPSACEDGAGGWVTIGTSSQSTGEGYGGYLGNYGANGAGESGPNGSVLTTPTGGGAGGANPCKKFKKQKDELTGLQQALINLEATTSQNHENGIFVDSNSPNVQNAVSAGTAAATVKFPDLSPPNKYKIMAHTHDAQGPTGTGTFSIFSWADILEVAAILNDNEADDDFFTMFLATADGTRYALTIDSTYSFLNFFNVIDPNNPTITDPVKTNALLEMEGKYYDDNAAVGSGKIGLATNPADDLKIFLKMMKEMGGGVSLFEVDPTYTVFTKLTLNSNGTAVVPKAPCN